jgi:hypothetical protein
VAARVDFNAIAGPARDAAHDTSMREAIELFEFGWDQGALRDIAGAIKRRLPSRRGLHLFAGGFDGLGIVV